MTQPIPATLNLTGDYALRWFRDFELPIQLLENDNPVTPLDVSGWTFKSQVRKRDTDETLVVTGVVTFDTVEGDGTGTDGWVRLAYPVSNWATTGEVNGRCNWDLVGIQASLNEVQLIEGQADTIKTTTETS